MRTTAYVLIGACLVETVTVRAENYQPAGRFVGSGRAWYGTLAVRTKTIS
jgi:hypothetical protein